MMRIEPSKPAEIAPREPAAGGRPVAWRDCAGVALAASALLAIVALFADLSRLHVTGLNDQIVYLSVARNLAERGELASNILYPATLWQRAPKNFIYMPGHMLALAASFKAFGFGPLAALLPALLSSVVSAVAVFWIGARRYGRSTGLLASALFMAVPAMILFAFTAMAESTFVAATLLAMVGCLSLPPSRQPWLGPLFLALPFLVRETGALAVLPMAGAVLESGGAGGGRRRSLGAGLCLLVALAWLAAVRQSPLAAGRPSITRANLLGVTVDRLRPAFFVDRYVYYDAKGQAEFAAAPPAELAHAMLVNAGRNLKGFREVAADPEPRLYWSIALLGMAACLALGVGRRDGFAAGAGLMTLGASLLLICFYNVTGDRGLRQILFTLPFGCLALARLLDLSCRRAVARRALWALAGVALLAGAGDALGEVRELSALDAWGEGTVRQVEARVSPDDRLAVVGPWETTLGYAFVHHPVKWAFLPANRYTLELLAKATPIGTLLLPVSRARARPQMFDDLTPADVRAIGLEESGRVVIRRRPYLVFKRPRT